MKTVYFILIGSLLLNLSYSQNWFALNSGTSNDLNSVYFVNLKTGYIVGETGTILKTENGGNDWVVQNSPTENSLNSVYFIDSKIGYIVGDIGTILKTTDGGTNWTVLNSGTGKSFNSVRFINADTGYITGGQVLKTTDGGINWIKQNWPVGGAFCIVDSKTIYAVGSYLCRYKTTDGGLSWTEYYVGYTGGRLNDIFFADLTSGIVVGEVWAQSYHYGIIDYTNDGGINWGGWNDYNSSGFNSVFLVNKNTAYAVGGEGIIVKSTNGGKNWTHQNSWTTNSLNSVYFSANIGYIVGNAGTILKIIEIGTETDQITFNDLSVNIYPNPVAGRITLDFNDCALIPEKISISILSLQGQLLFKQEIHQDKIELDLSGFKSGPYILKIINPDKLEVIKLIKE